MPRKAENRTSTHRSMRPSPRLVGDSAGIREVLRVTRCYARLNAPALVVGETGTGKELVARALHDAGPRRDDPFVVVACPNLPLSLIESELFGHTRGAFTGASENRHGAFERADGGTLFLDEIGDMPLEAQVKLLRAIQEGVIQRLGGREIRVDVRVVAATWRDLPAMVKEGSFREDLYNRLAWCVISLPPLRERGYDVVHIARALLKRGQERGGLPRRALSREVEDFLRAQPWPGNVRQMERVLFQAAATGSGRSLRVADLRRALSDTPSLSVLPDQPLSEPDIEALLRERGPMHTAELRSSLGVSRSTLTRWLEPLIREGKIEREGAGPATCYCLVEQVQRPVGSDPRWHAAMDIVYARGRITRGQLAAAIHCSERTATRVLGAMVQAGHLTEEGVRGRAAGYRLPDCVEL